MEQIKPKEKPKALYIIIFCFMLFTIILSIVAVSGWKSNSELSREIIKKDSLYNIKNTNLNYATKTRDSLNRVLTGIEPYRGLTDAMLFRDSSLMKIPYQVGQVVYLKPDSARVVINKVIIEGGKYEYFVGFSVVFEDRTTETISPDIIY